MAGLERKIGGIGEHTAAGAVDFGGYYLIKHSVIIALFGADGSVV